MRMARVWTVLLASAVIAPLTAKEPTFTYPLIKDYGGIATRPEAAELPRRGAKIVFDITADSKPDEIQRGIEAVARYLNLSAQAGISPSDLKLALVLHGGATRCALNDEAYAGATGAHANPNLPLLRELKKHNVALFVGGQSLSRNKFPNEAVAKELTIAVSAMTVNVNKQLDGYAYLAIH